MKCQDCDQTAQFKCVDCKNIFCLDCVNKIVVSGQGVYTCKSCKGRIREIKQIATDVQDQENIEELRNFWKMLPQMPLLPLVHEQWMTLISEALILTFLGLAIFLDQVSPNIFTFVIGSLTKLGVSLFYWCCIYAYC